ncbi:MAG: sodium-dependent transporter [Oscillospiraceae bacterium]|nr:sodium-dependent transporter [Oscillospiraceae bacterium]
MENRSGFKSNFGFLMAAVGSAVGLGNIWGFPAKMGANGGFTFLLVYIFLGLTTGIIVMISELAIGRKTGKGAVAAYQVVSKKFKWMGWMGIASAFLILFFYCALGGYCIKYVVVNVGDLFKAGFGSAGMTGADVFGNLLASPWEGVIYGLIFVALTMLIVLGGVAGGIEKVCSIGMPCLFVALLICIIRAVTLPGAGDGLRYMFIPGWAVAQGIVEKPNLFQVFSTAGGQMFFSLSLGMGAMITYGSYLDKKENIEKNALLIVLMDSLVAFMAALCVLPARFALDPEGALGGPSLLFVTMQNVFQKMGGIGPVFGIIFYLLVVFAAISSSISLLEVVVAHYCDKAAEKGKGDKRKKYTLIAAALVGLGCILVAYDSLGSQGIHPAALLGLENAGAWAADWLDFFDCISEGIMMPIGALLTCMVVGWEVGPNLVKEEVEQNGNKFKTFGYFKFCVRIIAPLGLLMVLYGQLTSFFG